MFSSFFESFGNKFPNPEDSYGYFSNKDILHRKEVIHPHVPVGIPCYDLTPVTYPTLAGPLLYRLGYQLQVLQASMA